MTATTAATTTTTLHWGSTATPEWLGRELITAPLSIEGFLTFQEACSGSVFGVSLTETLDWLYAHDQQLHEEALGHDEYYCLPMGYCRFGVYQDQGFTLIWYETTSGTILTQKWVNEEVQCYVGVPPHREHGFHHSVLLLSEAGMTRDLYQRWYNSHVSDLGIYAEKVAFHNPILIREGFDPLPTVEELIAERERSAERQKEELERADDYYEYCEEYEEEE